MNNQLLALAVLIILLVIFVAWATRQARQPKSVVVPSGAKAGDLALSPSIYKTKTKTYQAEYGTLVVPENRANPAARLIALPVKRIRSATAKPAEPIFYLTGGPGSSNLSFKPSDALLAEHDVIMVGYRGADGSVVLQCPEMNRASIGIGEDIFSSASLDAMGKALRAGADRLKSEGVDLDGYTIPEVVADLEAARLALGYPRIHLLSESYGTRVAQIYASLHPQSLRRSAMIGVNPPGHFVWEPHTIEEQLKYIAELGKRDATFSQRTPDLYASMKSVSQNMPRRWCGLPIDPGKVEAIAFMMLFHRNTSPMVFDAYLAAEKGDANGLALMSLMYNLMIPKAFIWGDLLCKGAVDYEAGRDYLTSLRKGETVIGSPASLLIWGSAVKGWPLKNLPAEYSQVHPTDVETLLVNGSMDVSTPLKNGRDELLPSLKNGRLVVLSEMGHVGDFWGVNRAAAERLLTSFYATGVADDSLFAYVPMDFSVKMGFPTFAKVLVLLTAFLIVPAVWVGGKLNQRGR
jgi:pimeloyl-ACP methyl ester carboxylesterase